MAYWVTFAKIILEKVAGMRSDKSETRSESRARCVICSRQVPREALFEGVCPVCRQAKDDHDERRQHDRSDRKRSGSQEDSRTSSQQGLSLEHAYKILGCSPVDSDGQIKRRYRELIKECHVDSLPKDLPDYLVQAANRRFHEVQEAYEKVMQARKPAQ